MKKAKKMGRYPFFFDVHALVFFERGIGHASMCSKLLRQVAHRFKRARLPCLQYL
jgi:hypothetical protein